jgi:hypothetical protein
MKLSIFVDDLHSKRAVMKSFLWYVKIVPWVQPTQTFIAWV